jgi:predicted kinase
VEAIIFIGIQGSGKSSFYRQRFSNTHMRINLDMLKTRNREQMFLKVCFDAKQPFVIDNTNVTEATRAPYIAQARSAGFRVIGYFFQTTLKEALGRNRQRTGKAVISIPGVAATYKRLQIPKLGEGFDELYCVSINERNEFIVERMG